MLDNNLLPLKEIPYNPNNDTKEKEDFETRMRVFGYTQEDLKTLIGPMSINAKEAIGSMNDIL